MMQYILMDLDGTLTNPQLGITKSIQYALRAYNIIIDDLDSLCRHIGPPLMSTFMDAYGFTEEGAEAAIRKYREYFSETGIYENAVYEGMTELLKRLKASGRQLYVATSKPEIFAKRILEHFKLDAYFDDICGATLDNKRSTKEEVIRYALDKNDISDHSKVVMVGDRMHDVEGAKAVGIDSIGVLYGFGSREELEKAGAGHIAETLEDLYRIIIQCHDVEVKNPLSR